jgi:hypothetical protein
MGIHEILRDKGVPQVELAAGIGIAESTLSLKLKGERRWRVEEANRVLAYLRERTGDESLTLDLLFGDGEAA